MHQEHFATDSDEPGWGAAESAETDLELAGRATNEVADSEDSTLTLLERLDRRQNRVLKELDRLNDDIERLVTQFQAQRQSAQAA